MKAMERTSTAVSLLSALFLTAVLSAAGCVSTGEERADSIAADACFDESLARFNYNMAVRFWNQGNNDLAVRYLRKSIDQDSGCVKAWAGLIDIVLANGSPERALSIIRSCPEKVKKDPEVMERRIAALGSTGDYESAAKVIREAGPGSVAQARLMRILADACLLEGDIAGALDFFLQAGRLDPTDAVVLEATARLSRLAGNPEDECNAWLKLVVLCPENAEFPVEAARACDRTEERRNGIAWLESFLPRAGPAGAGIKKALAFLHFQEGEWERSIDMYRHVRDEGGADLDREERLRISEALLRTGQDEAAAAELEKLLEENPDDDVVRAATVFACWRSGRVVRADEFINESPVEGELLSAVVKQMINGERVE